MYSGKIVGEDFFLLRDGKCIDTQTFAGHACLERRLEQLAFTLIYDLFLKKDGERVARVKSTYLAEFARPQFPTTLEFHLEDSQLRSIIDQTMSDKAMDLFNGYCERRLATAKKPERTLS